MKKLHAFVLGFIEFRSNFTTNCDGQENAYDWGREIAHRMTLRRFENT
jgi:hypothetical protein